MSLAHPRTMRLTDPEMPVVAALLGDPLPGALTAVAEAAAGELVEARVAGVTWWPGRSITVRYEVEVSGGPIRGRHSMVAVAGNIPEGATIVEGQGHQVGVWRVPHDPALPGLAPALDDAVVGRMLVDLGAEAGPVRTRLRAYRPGRRAVIEARGGEHDVFLKVIRPSRVAELHGVHRALSASVPIPASLGVDVERGIVALQALGGVTLRTVLEQPALEMPRPEQIVALTRLPEPDPGRMAASPIDRARSIGSVLHRITPELRPRVDEVIDMLGEESQPATVPVHGDYYEAQLMVSEGGIVGLLDVDTYGWGRSGDDAATMLGHLSVWAGLSSHPERVSSLGNQLLAAWDSLVDPVDLRLRAGAVVLSLASGPFRVQSVAWPSETADRVALAERWMLSASRVDAPF